MTVTYGTETLALRLHQLQAKIAAEGGGQVALRLGDLAGRLDQAEQRVTLAFCGLFSAGKSSLINALCDTEALATGAVPTTATVTGVTHRGHHGQVELLDTPGIDSTDAAHQAAMEAVLHRADMVVLVMDYQHVEAEDNLNMAQTLCAQGKPLILVIHQIDKHYDWELPFDVFCRRVEQTFTEYDIPYRDIFYTSTRSSEHNQIDVLRGLLDGLAMESQALVANSLCTSARDLVAQHVEQVFFERLRTAELTLTDVLGMVPFDTTEANAWVEEKTEQMRDLDQQRSAAISSLQEKQASVRAEFARMIDLAQVAPYDTTELGRLYVESLRPGFRVGWLGARGKTAKEMHHRLDAFLSELLDRTQKYLLWPLQNNLREFIQSAVWGIPSWLNDVGELSVHLSVETCYDLVHVGALSSDRYPYQYVKDVVSHVKRQVSSQLNQCFDKWFPEALAAQQSELDEWTQMWTKLQREQTSIQAWKKTRRLQAERVAELCTGLVPDADGQLVGGGA